MTKPFPTTGDNNGRLAKNIEGEWTLGWYDYTQKPPRYMQEQNAERGPLIQRAKNLGMTHLFDQQGRTTTYLPIGEVQP